MSDVLATNIRTLRRLTFGPRRGDVDRLAGMTHDELLAELLAAPPRQVEPPELGSDDDYSLLLEWWLEQMAAPDAGLHERMVWFWHGHLTSSLDKSDPKQILRQHLLLRQHALGNARRLLQAITLDAAMLWWLDGDGSRAEAPNENFAREVMELFALGHASGAYTEADVQAAAVAFSGWWVDEDGEVQYDPDAGPQRPVELLGRSVAGAEQAIDAICDHPACAPYLAGVVYRALSGVEPSEERRRQLGELFAASGLELIPLIQAIVSGPDFIAAPDRPRTPVEWWVAVRHLYQIELEPWVLDQMGQVPFWPPNVAGWPAPERWVAAGVTFVKAQLATDSAWDVETLADDDPVGDVAWRAGLVELSDVTRQVLDDAARRIESRRERATVLHALTAMSPEFSLA